MERAGGDSGSRSAGDSGSGSAGDSGSGSADRSQSDPRERAALARAWRHGAHAAICDVLEPWAHGTIARATHFPTYYDFNVVRVEEDPGMSVEELISFADQALAGLEHRRVDFEEIAAAESLRPAFEVQGWRAMRLLWMRHEVPPPPGPEIAVVEVPYEAVEELRLAWHREDFPAEDPTEHQGAARDVARRRNARVLAVREGDSPIGFAQLERVGDAAEIAQVYVHPDYRGSGRGTAITRKAIEAAGNVEDLWICADDDDRPKHLYVRLGFRPAWTTMEFLRLPRRGAA